jgi:hypothetical protein
MGALRPPGIIMLLLLMLLSIQACMAAQGGGGYGLVTSSPDYPLLAKGVQVNGGQVRPRALPISVEAGSMVCVPTAVYIDVDRRYVFRGWDDGLASPCRAVSANATYIAEYGEQVLIQVFSDLREYSRSIWADAGEIINLTAPEAVEGNGVRYAFLEWSGGEEPWSPRNHIVAVKPARIELRFEPMYLLTLTSSHGVAVNGSGYYRHGSMAVISAPEEVLLEPGRKLVFERWASIGPIPAIIPSERSSVTAIRVEAPYTIKAEYAEMYYVEALGLGGEVLARGWFRPGDAIQVSARPVVEAVPGEVRYVFKGWSDPSLPQAPSITISAERPMRIHAIYERQYRVEAAGEYGVSGSGWYPENSTAVIRAPATPQAALLIKRVFRGWAGDLDTVLDNRGDTLVLKVVRPVRIMAVYATEPDYISSIIVAGIITALAALGLRGVERRKPREAASKGAEEVRVISA